MDLSPGTRMRLFQRRLQTLKNYDEVELSGFLVGRRPPNAPRDALYLLLSPVPPSELRSVDFRSYAVIRLDEKTVLTGDVRPGSYVRVRGLLEPYPWGTLRMVRAAEVEGRTYEDYWRDMPGALSKNEVEGLFQEALGMRDDMRKAVLYALFGSPLVPNALHWGEGFEYTVYRHSGGIIPLWKALRGLYSLLPWEVRLGRGSLEVDDPFLGLDLRFGRPRSGMLYYVPGRRSSLRKVPERIRGYLEKKRAVGLLPREVKADPRDLVARLSEAPFVLLPSDERPYFEGSPLRGLVPNLMVTLSRARAEVPVLSGKPLERFQRAYLQLREWAREEYPEFKLLSVPSSFLNGRLHYLLSLRLFGAVDRFSGDERRALREVIAMEEAIINDWVVILSERPELVMALEREYERYVPEDVRAQRALAIIHDLASTSDLTRESVVSALVRHGFSERDAVQLLEGFLALGYLYEPFPGRLKVVPL